MPAYETRVERADRRRRESIVRSARRRDERRETREPDARAIGSALVALIVPRLRPDVTDAVVAALVGEGYDRDASAAALVALAARAPKTSIASNRPTYPRGSSTSP